MTQKRNMPFGILDWNCIILACCFFTISREFTVVIWFFKDSKEKVNYLLFYRVCCEYICSPWKG